MNTGANTKSSGRKKVSFALLVLLVAGLISTVLLASILNGLSNKEKKNYLSLDDDTSGGAVASDPVSGEGDEGSQTDEGKLEIVHSRKIFCSSYKNGQREVTVLSDDGKKVIAPGTSWNYSFTLKNTRQATLRYTIHTEAIIEGLDKDLTLPVLSRFSGPNGWLTSDGSNYTPVMELNGLAENGVLSPNTIADYKLSWEWPFESGDDEFDTWLGNEATDHDITLTIIIYVFARESTDSDEQGGDPIPGTGDDFRIGFWLAAMIISLFAFVAVLAGSRRKGYWQASRGRQE
jgi:hypothetical protein